MVVCSHCNRKTREGRYCEKCGGELSFEDTSAVASVPAPSEVFNTDDVLTSSGDVSIVEQGPGTVSCDEAETRLEQVDRRIEERIREAEERLETAEYRSDSVISQSTAPADNAMDAPQRENAVVLDMDRLGVLYEGLRGSVRFRLIPPAREVLRDVSITLSDDISGTTRTAHVPYVDSRTCDRFGNLIVGFPGMEAGSYVWNVELSFVRNNLRRVMKTSFELVVMRPENSVAIAEQIVFNINNDIKAEGAADVHVSNRIADELRSLTTKCEDPTRVLQKIVNGRDRAWCHMDLFDATDRAVLPPAPRTAVTDSVTLDFGFRVIRLFAGRTVTLGRNRACDIIFRPKAGASERERLPFSMLSRRHCFFEHQGDNIAVSDGSLNDCRVRQPSSYGTYFNDERVGSPVMLRSGDKGCISFAGPSFSNALALDVKTTSPKRSCANCPYSNRKWCGEGRPSLVLSRRDGVLETFVCLWSCFHLDEIDRSFNDVVIFRKEGAFAWVRGQECGWLVPGTVIHTDYGTIKVN